MFKAKRLFKFRVSPNSKGRIRFTALGLAGFIAVRKTKSRGFGIERQPVFIQIHLGRISVALERSRPARNLWNFAG